MDETRGVLGMGDNGVAVCLLVEDSRTDQEIITGILRRAALSVPVVIAASLDEAQSAMRRHRVRLMLLDNNLPDGRGADFAVRLAAERGLARFPVVILTDWPSPFMFEKARAAGVRAVVSKQDFGLTTARSLLCA